MDDRSENIQVINMGATTEGNPFLLAIISSASNLARLDELKRINAQMPIRGDYLRQELAA